MTQLLQYLNANVMINTISANKEKSKLIFTQKYWRQYGDKKL